MNYFNSVRIRTSHCAKFQFCSALFPLCVLIAGWKIRETLYDLWNISLRSRFKTGPQELCSCCCFLSFCPNFRFCVSRSPIVFCLFSPSKDNKTSRKRGREGTKECSTFYLLHSTATTTGSLTASHSLNVAAFPLLHTHTRSLLRSCAVVTERASGCRPKYNNNNQYNKSKRLLSTISLFLSLFLLCVCTNVCLFMWSVTVLYVMDVGERKQVTQVTGTRVNVWGKEERGKRKAREISGNREQTERVITPSGYPRQLERTSAMFLFPYSFSYLTWIPDHNTQLLISSSLSSPYIMITPPQQVKTKRRKNG